MKKGWTLIELMIVAIIIAVLVGISLPSVRKTLDNFRLEMLLKDIFYLCKYLQEVSIGEARIHCLNIGRPDQGFYAEYKQDNQFVGLDNRLSRRLYVPKDITVDIDPAGKERVYFYPDGSMDKVNFVFTGRYGKEMRLNIQDGSAGQIKIE